MNSSVASMLVNPPGETSWELGGFRVLAEKRSASGPIGGDFFLCHLRGPKRLAVVIGDACGRGTEAAKLLPSVLPGLEQLIASVSGPSQLLQQLNQRLAGRLANDCFVTGAAFEIDAEQETLTVANAGHVPALLRRADGRVTVIGQALGPPLGILPEFSYPEECCRFRSGDLIVLMTDGMLEAVETDLTGMPNLSALVAQAPGGSKEVHRRLLVHLADATQNQSTDDVTLLSLELMGTESTVAKAQPTI